MEEGQDLVLQAQCLRDTPMFALCSVPGGLDLPSDMYNLICCIVLCLGKSVCGFAKSQWHLSL